MLVTQYSALRSNISRFSGYLSFDYMYQYVYAGSFRLPYFPGEAVFAVTRNGSKIGFRSLGYRHCAIILLDGMRQLPN